MCRGEIQSELFMDYVGGRRLNRCHDNALNAGSVPVLKKLEKPLLFLASFMGWYYAMWSTDVSRTRNPLSYDLKDQIAKKLTA
ncbi:hypothetical protein TNIN_43811 [Trichonephila inaurata madagascariensis]|uniref:Uncharacterized protein n=1 Tax=Trichonephila inaurata madagascariensis TaxID=2747483 RepID=A0A8X7BQK0_9ARAC|nr:hypothetical protein TNIN_43811 [Trichonephila inaurata madagascariensis]